MTKETEEKKAVKPKSKKTAQESATITLVQTGSPIGRQGYQRATLIGLGLNKLRRKNTLQDTPAVRGMIKKVGHLVTIENK